MKEEPEKALFIFGYPRSGTTLLWSLLNTHSKIKLFLEPELIRGMLFAGLKFSDRVNRRQCRDLLEKMGQLGVTKRHLSTLPDENLANLVSATKELSFKEVYELLLPRPRDARVWGEKSLGNAFYIDKLQELYPNAVFVNIVRNPCAALLSHYRKKNAASRAGRPVLEMRSVKFFAHSALLWKRWVKAVERSRRRLKDAAVIQVVYKDFVNNPEEKLREICGAAGIEFEPQMLDVSQRRKSSQISPEFKYAHRNLTRPIDPERAKAGGELPGWASYIVEKYAAEEMEKYGFPTGANRAGLMEKIRVDAHLLLLNKKIRSDVDQRIAGRKYPYDPANQTFLQKKRSEVSTGTD